MNLNQQQTRYAGIALITLAVVIIFNLWGLIPVALLAGGGAMIYQRERSMGRTNSAVQAGLWGLGLALLYMLDFVLPGVLLLAGASLLLRGKEDQADARVQRVLSRMPRRRIAPVAPAASTAPAQPKVTIVNDEKTIRLS